MKKEYRIITDGACDLAPELCREKGIIVVPFYVSFDGEKYEKEIVEMPIRHFYEEMVSHPKVFPKSSMPSVQDYLDAFTPVVEDGKAIICICITTKFSGSMQSALNARMMLLEQHPDAEITVIDSTVDTVLQGNYVLEAWQMWDKGIPYEQAVAELEAIKATGRIFFTVGNLEYLQHGGRIGKVASIAGSVLGIRPLITLKEGEIFASGIARGRNRSLDKVRELLAQYLEEVHAAKDLSDYRISVGAGYDLQEAQEFQQAAVDFLNGKGYQVTKEQFPIYQIGATISVHTGPYPLGFGIIRRNQYAK